MHEQLLMDGIAGATKPGNTQLVDYGIQNDKSDVRAHVGVLAKQVYVFKTKDGFEAIDPRRHRKRPAFTRGIRTAEGYCVPDGDIPSCMSIPIPNGIFAESRIGTYPEKGRRSEKGQAAVFIVTEMLKRGLLPLQLEITEIDDKTMQIRGEDVHVKANIKIQVKCDYRAGNGHPRCTGNLYLQIAECNPFGIH